MKFPQSTFYPIEFPTSKTWQDNPRLATGQSIALLIQRAQKSSKSN